MTNPFNRDIDQEEWIDQPDLPENILNMDDFNRILGKEKEDDRTT